MQVIGEIIRYLDDRGLLGPDDIRYLRRHGFVAGAEENDVADLASDDELRILGVEPAADRTEELAEQFDRRLGARRAGRGRRPAGKDLPAAGISARILARWPEWQPDLAALRAFANLLAPAADLDAALRVLRHAAPDALEGAVMRVLGGDGPRLDELWKALAFDGYRDGILDPDARGPAVRAYRAVLAAAEHRELGRYAYAMRQTGFARLHRLVLTQRAVLGAVGRLVPAKPALFDRPLFAHRCDEVCYWSLTFAVSARLAARPGPPGFRMHDPRRPWPRSEAGVRRAWACAAAMDSHAATAFRAGTMSEGDSVDNLDLALLFGGRFGCPVAWDIGYGFAEPESIPADLPEPGTEP